MKTFNIIFNVHFIMYFINL